MWTDGAHQYDDLNSLQNSFVRVVNAVNGELVFYFDQPGAAATVQGFKADTLGNPNWIVSPMGVGTSGGSKGRMDLAARADGTAIVAWHDNRMGNNDVYAQRVNLEGSLGNPPPPVPAEIAVFVTAWVTSISNGTLAGDYDRNSVVEPSDIAAFISHWSASISTG